MSNTALASPALVGQSVRELQERIQQLQATKLDTRSLPTHPALARLLPGGALKEGATYSIDRSITLLMLLLAGPSEAGSWCGVVGIPEFGVEAAAGFGISLERLALVPHPGDQWLAVTAAIADVMNVVAVRPPRQASDGSIARLAARLRKRGATLLVLGGWSQSAGGSQNTGGSQSTAWPQSEAALSITESHWYGIGDGHGHLSSRQATVTVTSRVGGKPRSARLVLPGGEWRSESEPRLLQGANG